MQTDLGKMVVESLLVDVEYIIKNSTESTDHEQSVEYYKSALVLQTNGAVKVQICVIVAEATYLLLVKWL